MRLHSNSISIHPAKKLSSAKNLRINAQSTQESTRILDIRVLARNQHDEAHYSKQRHKHIDQPSLLSSVCNGTNDNGEDSGTGVGRHREQVCCCAAVAEGIDDGGEEEREGVEGAIGSHVDDGETPGLPVGDGLPEVGHFELL